jgi:peptide/nickel transport system permease protein
MRVWQALKRDRIPRVAFWVLLALYAAVGLADFLAPVGPHWANRRLANAPPTPIYTIHEGQLTWPYVFKVQKTFNEETFLFEYKLDRSRRYPVKLFTQGEPHALFEVIPTRVHFFGVDSPAHVALLGYDMNGRDNFARLLYGGRVSLTIGFLSLFIAFPIGLIYGGIAGYFGGRIDNAMMRLAEVIMSIPGLYLLIGLAAILPPGLSSTARFAMVTSILAFVGWAGLSRVIRGMVLSIKNQEFIEAARAQGMGSFGIITRHVLPQTASYVIVALTVGVPGYILAESGLSFLGLGIQQPDASWGNMLKEAQDINNILNAPWMLAPGVLIFLAVLAFNVVGDAVRDALDPRASSPS